MKLAKHLDANASFKKVEVDAMPLPKDDTQSRVASICCEVAGLKVKFPFEVATLVDKEGNLRIVLRSGDTFQKISPVGLLKVSFLEKSASLSFGNRFGILPIGFRLIYRRQSSTRSRLEVRYMQALLLVLTMLTLRPPDGSEKQSIALIARPRPQTLRHSKS